MVKPYKAVIEGAKMIVCGDCVKLGHIYWEVRLPRQVKRAVRPPPKIFRKPRPTIPETLELIEGYSSLVRQARQKLGLSHKDLGRKIGEKVSVLRKIESGKMTPDNKLAEKLEHTLKIKLLIPPSEQKHPPTALTTPPEVTLGEVIRLKRRKTEATKKRKPS